MEAVKIRDTEGKVETKALVDKLPYILTFVESQELVDAVVVSLAKLKAEKPGDSCRVGR